MFDLSHSSSHHMLSPSALKLEKIIIILNYIKNLIDT